MNVFLALRAYEATRANFSVSDTSSRDRSTKREIAFENATDERLRSIAEWDNPKITRAQLLAACRNRYPCGYYVEIVSDESPPIFS
jgi:hypothetical protein